MRLIDADVLEIEMIKAKSFGELSAKGAIRKVQHAPTVDAEPVRHGHWEKYDVYGDINFRCSACKKAKFHNGEMIQKYRYCYNCGAKMHE